MSLYVQSMTISASRGDITRFEINGLCDSDSVHVLQELMNDSLEGLELFKAVKACEWCGSLYPRRELRCRKGCGGPRTR